MTIGTPPGEGDRSYRVEQGGESLTKRIKAKILAILEQNREAVYSSEDPFETLIQIGAKEFVDRDVVEGEENIPEHGRVILAPNHKFGIIDVSFLINHLLKRHNGRPWMVVGNVGTYSKLFPEWESDPKFLKHIVPVRREEGTHSRITNGREVLNASVDFLSKVEDPVLIIHPEGADNPSKGVVTKPHKGLARIARESGAKIVPVVFSGEIDSDSLKFRVQGKICQPFDASTDDEQTLATWQECFEE